MATSLLMAWEPCRRPLRPATQNHGRGAPLPNVFISQYRFHLHWDFDLLRYPHSCFLVHHFTVCSDISGSHSLEFYFTHNFRRVVECNICIIKYRTTIC